MRLLDARLLQEQSLNKTKIVHVKKEDVEPTIRYISLAANIPYDEIFPKPTFEYALTL